MGTGSTILRSRAPNARSSTQYWPWRGQILISSPSARPLIVQPASPAASARKTCDAGKIRT
jgi:hypothetical protein